MVVWIPLADEMPGSFSVFPPGDTHLGNPLFREKPLRRFIDYVLTKKHAVVGWGGDLIETIAPGDKRYKIKAVDPTKTRADLQWRAFLALADPLKDRTEWVLQGNHEDKIENIVDVTNEIALGLDAVNGNVMAKIDFGCFRLFDWHGWGRCNSRAGDPRQRRTNEEIFVKRQMRDQAGDCDVMVMHHIHKMYVHKPTSQLVMTHDANVPGGGLRGRYTQPTRIPLPDERYYIPEEHRWYASSGSFLGAQDETGTFSPYTEKFGLPPVDLGCVEIIVKNDKLQGVKRRVFE